jgi:hypothetical protein
MNLRAQTAQSTNGHIASLIFTVASEIISGFNFGMNRKGKVISVEIAPDARELIRQWGTQKSLDSIRQYDFKLKETEGYHDLVAMYHGCLHEAALQFAVHLAKSEGEDELIGYFCTYCALMSDLLSASSAGNFYVIRPRPDLPPS